MCALTHLERIGRIGTRITLAMNRFHRICTDTFMNEREPSKPATKEELLQTYHARQVTLSRRI